MFKSISFNLYQASKVVQKESVKSGCKTVVLEMPHSADIWFNGGQAW